MKHRSFVLNVNGTVCSNINFHNFKNKSIESTCAIENGRLSPDRKAKGVSRQTEEGTAPKTDKLHKALAHGGMQLYNVKPLSSNW